MQTAPSSTLARHWVPERSLLGDLGLVVGFSLFTGLMAHIAVPLPFTPVPITGQTFAVLLCGAALGARLGTASMLLYITEGVVGLPVFAAAPGSAGCGQVDAAALGTTARAPAPPDRTRSARRRARDRRGA